MKLLIHNMICCLKCNHFPLAICATEIKEEQHQSERGGEGMDITTQHSQPEEEERNQNLKSLKKNKQADQLDDDDENSADENEEEEEEDDEEGRNPRRKDSDYIKDFVMRMIPKLEWSALVSASKDLTLQEPSSIPDSMPENIEYDRALQRILYHLLNEVKILNGELVCTSCSARFTIKNGIPNLVLRDDQITK